MMDRVLLPCCFALALPTAGRRLDKEHLHPAGHARSFLRTWLKSFSLLLVFSVLPRGNGLLMSAEVRLVSSFERRRHDVPLGSMSDKIERIACDQGQSGNRRRIQNGNIFWRDNLDSTDCIPISLSRPIEFDEVTHDHVLKRAEEPVPVSRNPQIA